MDRLKGTSLTKPLAVAAMVAGVAAGSYGIASAATGTTTTSTTTTPSITATAPPAARSGPPGATAQNPWGSQRSDETPLTGDTLAKVKDAAVAEVGSAATIVRVETDADGHAAYEAHVVKADGTPATVYVDGSFAVVGVDSR